MKIRTYCMLLAATLLSSTPVRMKAQVQTDPALTAAIQNQTSVLKGLFNRRDSTQKKIIKAEIAVTAAMERMHEVEDKVLGYMSNVQGAFQNLYEIKRAGELVAVDIPKNIGRVKAAIKSGGFQGTVMATVVGDQLVEVTTEMMSLYPFLAQLCSSGTIEVQGEDGEKTKKKVNLLDSAERYYICNTVVSKLENINTSLYLLAWQIQTMKWRDLFYHLDPDGWINYMTGKNIVQGIISDWDDNLKIWKFGGL